MRKLFLVISIFSFFYFLNAQNSQWVNYTCGTFIRNVAEEGNIMWIGTRGGMVQLDKTTGIPTFYNVTNSDLPSNLVGPIVIDGAGTKWIGTGGGLAKFDGTNWTVFNIYNSGLPDNNVKCLISDDNGVLWMGTDNGIAKFDGTNWTVFTSINSGLPSSVICSLAIDGDGSKWIGTYAAGLVKFDGTTWTVYNSTNSGLPDNSPYSVAIDGNGMKWIGTGMGLTKFDDINWTTYTHFNSGLPPGVVLSIAIDGNGSKWIGTATGLAKFDNTNWTIYDTSNSGLPDNVVYCIFLGANGLKWTGTHRGLAKFDGTNWTPYETSNSGLAGSSIYSFAIDGSGSKWFGSEGGISKFDGSAWTTYYTPSSVYPSDEVYSIAIDGNNLKWLGIQNTGLIKFDDTNWTIYNTSNSGLPNNNVTSIVIDGVGTKWIGTIEGIAKFDGTNWTVYNTSNSGLPDNTVSSIAIDPGGSKWIGTYSGGIAKFDDTNWTVYNVVNSGLPELGIRSIVIDGNGTKWIGTFSSGLAKFDGTTWTVFNTSNSGLPDDHIYSLATDINGSIWIGTGGGGLSIFDGTNWTTFNPSNSGLPGTYISSIAIDGNIMRWVGTADNGLAGYENSQATNLSFTGIQSNQVNINWMDGYYSKRAVFIKQADFGTAVPINNSTYIANTNFGSGTQIGTTGWYCIFNGTTHTSGVTVSNLFPSTTYRVMVCEYNGAPGSEQYNINLALGNPENFSTTSNNVSISTSSSPTNGGTTSGGGNYIIGQTATVTATPNAGYNFINWTENGNPVATTTSYSFAVSVARDLVANFVLQQFAVTTSSNPANGGNTSGDGTYNYGTLATVIATPATNWNFVNWTENGSIVSLSATYSFTVAAARNLVANFALQQFTIVTTCYPTNGGYTTGGGMYNYGDQATLTATPYSGKNFVNWTENGNIVSTDPVCNFTVTENRSLVANFELQQFTISTSPNSADGGTTSGAGTYDYGAQATVSATPNSSWTFLNWTENGNVVSSSAVYSFTVSADRSLVANFTQSQTYIISTESSPALGGETSGGGNYLSGETAIVTASVNTGYNFANWTENGNIVSADSVYSFTVTGNRYLVANFEPQKFPVGTISIPAGSGTTNGGGLYDYGSTATITATSGKSWEFYEWTENCNPVSTNSIYSFLVTSERELAAVFYQPGIQYVTSTLASPFEGGYITGCGPYDINSQATVNAIPYSGWDFVNWTENGSAVSGNPSYVYTVANHRSLTANFVQHYTGIVKPDFSGILVYPNPTRDKLFLEWDAASQQLFDEVNMYNTLSQVVYHDAKSNYPGKLTLDVSGFKPGIYYLILTSQGRKIVDFKIVVKP